MAGTAERYEVARAPSRRRVMWIVLPVAALAFGAGFVYLLVGRPALDGLARPLALAVSGVGTLILVGGWITELRRSRGPALAVDATGIQLAGMPWLDWADVAEVRSEEIVALRGEDSGSRMRVGGMRVGVRRPRTAEESRAAASVYRRLGVVPRNRALGTQGGLLDSIARASLKLREKSLAQVGGRAIELAPFGVYDWELGAPFAEVLARVQSFHAVTEVSDLAGVAD